MLRLVIFIPFLAVLIIFLFANAEPVPMNLFVIEWKSSVGFFVLLVGLASFAIGALTVFISVVGQWRRARKAEQVNRDLEKKLNDLQSQYIAALNQKTTTSPITTMPVVDAAPVQE